MHISTFNLFALLTDIVSFQQATGENSSKTILEGLESSLLISFSMSVEKESSKIKYAFSGLITFELQTCRLAVRAALAENVI